MFSIPCNEEMSIEKASNKPEMLSNEVIRKSKKNLDSENLESSGKKKEGFESSPARNNPASEPKWVDHRSFKDRFGQSDFSCWEIWNKSLRVQSCEFELSPLKNRPMNSPINEGKIPIRLRPRIDKEIKVIIVHLKDFCIK